MQHMVQESAVRCCSEDMLMCNGWDTADWSCKEFCSV